MAHWVLQMQHVQQDVGQHQQQRQGERPLLQGQTCQGVICFLRCTSSKVLLHFDEPRTSFE